MAKPNVLRGETAPAAKLATATPALPSEALQARVNALTADKKTRDSVRAACKAAFDAGTSKGYNEQLAASQAIGLDWEALANWTQTGGEVEDHTSEALVRKLHNRFEPESSPEAEKQAKDLLRDVANASTPDIVASVKQRYTLQPGREKDADPKAAVAKLETLRDQAGDPAMATLVQAHLDAINNRDAMEALNRKLNQIAASKTRFRARLFAHVVHPLVGVPVELRGSHYDIINNRCLAAHKAFSKLTGQDKGGDPAERLRTDVMTSIDAYVTEKFGRKVKVELDDDDKAKLAADAFEAAVKKVAGVDLLTNNEARNLINKIRNALATKHSITWETPSEAAARQKKEAQDKREADKLAADEAAGKVAKPKSTRGKAQAGKVTRVRTAPPASGEATTAQATPAKSVDTVEDVLADMTA